VLHIRAPHSGAQHEPAAGAAAHHAGNASRSCGRRGGPQGERAPCRQQRPLPMKLACSFFLVPWIKRVVISSY
jgi:hypothetical protein